jgi:NAD(P)-dependent dehydrogenase (short-subunit alcohol dehydrogenase family)
LAITFQGRVAIVTGAGAGLGRAHALALADRGARVIVNDLDVVAALEVRDMIMGRGGEAIADGASVTDKTAVEKMVDAGLRRWGAIDILVNNAGILRDKTFSKMDLADFEAVMNVHVMGSVNCIKAVWSHMAERRYGRIILTTSSSGLYGNFGQSNYSAAKMALVGLMQTLAIEGQRYEIRVNCLAPSAATAMTDKLYENEALAALDATRVSAAVLALASEQAPNRRILLAGAGSFEQANITMTRGVFLGAGSDVAEQLLDQLDAIADREDEMIPGCGPEQFRYEVLRARSGGAAMPSEMRG